MSIGCVWNFLGEGIPRRGICSNVRKHDDFVPIKYQIEDSSYRDCAYIWHNILNKDILSKSYAKPISLPLEQPMDGQEHQSLRWDK